MKLISPFSKLIASTFRFRVSSVKIKKRMQLVLKDSRKRTAGKFRNAIKLSKKTNAIKLLDIA